MPLATDSRLGPYQILSLVGSGAMGEVYRARDTRLNRVVAIKTVAAKAVSGKDASADAIERLEHEAQAVSALNHPNILTVHDVGREHGIAYIVTELVEGESLRSVLSRRGALRQRELLDIGIQIAEGLAAAHDEGIIHRDLKPENLMISRDDRVKILDFGIAKVVEEALSDQQNTIADNDTTPGLLLGTTAYMSPEQARGTRVTYDTDQFSLGIILYEMATGTNPFRRDSPLATLSAILTEDVPVLEHGSPLFQWVVKRLLHKEPDHRYGTMHDVARELRAIRSSVLEPVEAEVSEPLSSPVDTLQSVGEALSESAQTGWQLTWQVIALVAIGALVLTLAGVWIGSQSGRSTIALDYRRFTPATGLAAFPAWSPDGRSIAWSGEAGGMFQIFAAAATADGSTAAQLTRMPDDAFEPVWSPDSTRIFFRSGGKLFVISAAGGEPRETTEAFPARAQSVHSDGTHLFTGKSALTTGAGVEIQPSVSPDGKEVVFTALHTVGSGSTDQLSPDHQRSLSTRDGSIWITNLRTGMPIRLTQGAHPAWSADGRAVAFDREQSIYVVVPGGNPELIARNAEAPRWLDEQTLAARSTDGRGLVIARRGSPEAVRRIGSGYWLVYAAAPGNKTIAGTRVLNRQLEHVQVDIATGAESLEQRIGPEPPSLVLCRELGLEPADIFGTALWILKR